MATHNDPQQYTQMQQTHYDWEASQWSLDNRDPVVGSFDAHNGHADYEYLFVDIPDATRKIALDFACGPGRNLVQHRARFAKYDGVDISQTNLDKARIWLTHNGVANDAVALYKCNGRDLSDIPDASYDVITSTIALQHICVHEIRFGYFQEFFRVLKEGGQISCQMGIGPKYLGQSVDYHANFWDALATNGACDTRVEDPKQLSDDLEKIGFVDFKYYIRPVGPGGSHANWIFFSARKTALQQAV